MFIFQQIVDVVLLGVLVRNPEVDPAKLESASGAFETKKALSRSTPDRAIACLEQHDDGARAWVGL
jgi:hypothetical protein